MDKQTQIFEAARKLFLKQGFKSTNIAAITTQAGVAVGSFYHFFNSKEDIFIQVYNYENEVVKQKIMNNLNLNQEPQQLLEFALKQIFKYTRDNKVLQEWFNDSKINHLITQQNIEHLEEGVVYATLNQLVEKWISEQKTKPEMSKERIMELFNALTIIDIHQNEIQSENYFQLLNDLITGILAVIMK